MGIIGIFNHVVDAYKFNSRIKNDKPELDRIEQELDNKISLLNKRNNGNEDPLTQFKEISEDQHLKLFFDKYTDLMVDNLPHSATFKLLFKKTAQNMPAKDTMAMASHITQNSAFQKAVNINDYHSEQVELGLYQLAQKCSKENKTELYSMLDNTFLDDCLQNSNNMNIAMFITEIFKDIETGEALNILKNSVAWTNIEYSDSLYEQLDSLDQRLTRAMDYTKNSVNNTIRPTFHNI